MTGDNRIIDAQSLIRWLVVMEEGMNLHRGNLYYEGAAKSYHSIIEVVQSGIFDKRRSEDNGG
ncbi:hypothetical protein [Pelosinus fermentans]|uniref:Uncharacterized protein n=1 Tax=Pelosinus fermentans JBW45 TaxID=1192197 RepID=I8TQQ9_9FIRM|nr:hypothetical protein [Pelosinus fermentans]AJQ26948.1 hypothetical protein JBW_01598 [Pelosinus fermentans JBW45]